MDAKTKRWEDKLEQDIATLSLRHLTLGTILAAVISLSLFAFSLAQIIEISDLVFVFWCLAIITIVGARSFIIFKLKNELQTEGFDNRFSKQINRGTWIFGLSDGIIWLSVNWFIFDNNIANEYLGISLSLGAAATYSMVYLFQPRVAAAASGLAIVSSLVFLYFHFGSIPYQFMIVIVPFGGVILFFLAELKRYILESLREVGEHALSVEHEKELNSTINQHWNNTPLAAIEWDPKYVITRWNPSAESIFGYKAEEAIGNSLELIFLEEDIKKIKDKWRTTWRSEKGQRSIQACINKDGYPVHCEWHDSPLSKNGIATGITSFVEDISAQVESEEVIKNQANFDNLTGLPNRRQMIEKIDHAIKSCKHSRQFSALIFLDLDHFKDVNDTQGHDVGDIVLQEFGKKLQPMVRHNDTVSRFGGDEFVILLEDLGKTRDGAIKASQLIADKLLTAGENLCQLGGLRYDLDVSGGIALFDGNTTNSGEILKSADLAMYQVKQNGRKGICFYDESLSLEAEYRVEVLRSLRNGLKGNKFELYGQAIVDCNGNACYFENLLRWQRSGTQVVSAADFIDILASSPMIIPVGYWVFESVCKNINKLRQQNLWADDSAFFVNVSPKQLLDKDFANRIQDMLKENNIDPHWVVIEITEESLIDNYDDVIRQLNKLVDYGLRFALDDFGSGYSSLALLKDLPIEFLKLDKEFIRDLKDSQNDSLIVQAIIKLCDIMSLKVIAEGVETEEQFEILKGLGCDYIQGYYSHRPAPLTNLSRYLQASKSTEKAKVYKFERSLA